MLWKIKIKSLFLDVVAYSENCPVLPLVEDPWIYFTSGIAEVIGESANEIMRQIQMMHARYLKQIKKQKHYHYCYCSPSQATRGNSTFQGQH